MARVKKRSALAEQLRKELPGLLRDDPELRGQVIAILGDYFTTREETAAILTELREMRADFGRRMDELGRRIDEQGRRFDRTLGAIGARWGMMTEEAFRDGVRALFAHEPDIRVESWRHVDRDGKVFGHPSEIELDAVVRDGTQVLIEIKSYVSVADLYAFWHKAELHDGVTGRPSQRRLIISPFVDSRALETAKTLGIEVHTSSSPPPI